VWPEGLPADRSVNSDQNAHLNQQSRRPAGPGGQSTGAIEGNQGSATPGPTGPPNNLRIQAQLESLASGLRESAGTGTVADNLTTALTTLFGPVAVAIIPLITFRDELRARLRQAMPDGGVPIPTQAAAAISTYLTDERELGRIAADVDVDSLTLSLVGGGHMLFSRCVGQ
jgi:hypothetical protein